MEKNFPYILTLIIILSGKLYAQNLFIDIADSLNMNHSYGDGNFGGGLSFCDFDGDGWDDISLTSEYGSDLVFYKNQQGVFQKLSQSFVNHIGEAKSLIWVDFDNDGDKDLFVSSYLTPSQLFQNDGNFQFTDITQSAGLKFASMPSYGVCWGDYDRDGLVDLYVTNRVAGGFQFSNYLYKIMVMVRLTM